jgi:hypothetical protein
MFKRCQSWRYSLKKEKSKTAGQFKEVLFFNNGNSQKKL